MSTASFFDDEYIALWASALSPQRTAREVDQLWSLLALAPGMRVLDAPCGYGRISRGLAERGATVLGVDASQAQLDHAERMRGDLPVRYRFHDLRHYFASLLIASGLDVKVVQAESGGSPSV